MVFEQLFRIKWIERKEHAFFLGFFYSVVALISARLIFPSNVGMMSIAFASVLLIPSLNILLRMEENAEIRENKLSIMQLFKDHKDIFKVYVFMFLGVFLAYSITALLLPSPAIQSLFSAQLRGAGMSGSALSEKPFEGLIVNNLIVFLVCFFLSLIYGAGSVLFLVWNASVWGAAFGFFVKQASSAAGKNIAIGFAGSILPFLPHMVTEALAYISAAIVGGIVSKAVLREKLFSRKFYHIITDALIFLAIGVALVLAAGFIEVRIYALM